MPTKHYKKSKKNSPKLSKKKASKRVRRSKRKHSKVKKGGFVRSGSPQTFNAFMSKLGLL
jgi:hypothetical protein